MIATSGELTSNDRYVPSLDGLRAVSILLVVGSHFGLKPIPGIFGVTIFFFVSGYLITGQILEQLDRNGRFSLPNFYIRRVLRLYPALLAMVALAGLAFVAVGGPVTVVDVLAATFYLGNFDQLLGFFGPGPLDTPHPYSVLWSLAVEEHFYLVFPCLALLLARRRVAFITLILGVIVAVTLWRAHMAQACQQGCVLLRIEHGTDTRVDSILYGALLASMLASPVREWTLRLLGRAWSPAIGAVLLVAALVIRDPWFRDVVRFAFQGVGLFLVIGAIIHEDRLRPARLLLGHPVLVLVGRWSYSLYLWHWVVCVMARIVLPAALAGPLVEPTTPPAWWMAGVFTPLVALSLAAAAASYYGIERPMLRARRAFGSHGLPDVGTPLRRGGTASARAPLRTPGALR